MPEQESCVFCGGSASVKLIGGNKGICNTCAENLADTLIHTQKSLQISREIHSDIDDHIEEHKSEDHK